MLNLSRENRRPVSRPAQVKAFLKTGGFRLSNFTLISYNVMWILTIPVLPNLRSSRTAKSFLATFPLDWSPLPVQSPIGSAQGLLNHVPTRLVTSSSQVSYWFRSSAPEPLSHSAGHLFQSSLLLVQLKCS